MTNKLFNVEEVLELHNSGMYAKDIANQIGCDYGTVKNYLKELGISPKKKRLEITEEIINQIIKLAVEDKKTNKQIAEIVGSNPTTVRKILKEKNIKTNSIRTKSILNKELVLTDEQKAILYGTLLGDASIGIQINEARISFIQGRGQEEYFDLKCEKFKEILGKINKTPRYDKRINKYIERYAVRSLCHPIFTKLYKELYPNGIKTITKQWLNKLTPQSLAYWFMDDGSNCGTLCTNCFSYEEHLLMQQYFIETWGIETTIQKNYDQYMLYITKSGKEKFAKLVKPYIIPSMSYKIKNWIPEKSCELRETPVESQILNNNSDTIADEVITHVQ